MNEEFLDMKGMAIAYMLKDLATITHYQHKNGVSGVDVGKLLEYVAIETFDYDYAYAERDGEWALGVMNRVMTALEGDPEYGLLARRITALVTAAYIINAVDAQVRDMVMLTHWLLSKVVSSPLDVARYLITGDAKDYTGDGLLWRAHYIAHRWQPDRFETL